MQIYILILSSGVFCFNHPPISFVEFNATSIKRTVRSRFKFIIWLFRNTCYISIQSRLEVTIYKEFSF